MFASRLDRATVECIHFAERSQLPNITDITKLGLFVGEIAGENIRTKADLMAAIAEAMNFPEYFGKNWDALDECLRDLNWISAKGYVLIIHHANQLWEHAALLAGQLVESWLFCDESWLQQKVPFHLIFEMAKS